MNQLLKETALMAQFGGAKNILTVKSMFIDKSERNRTIDVCVVTESFLLPALRKPNERTLWCLLLQMAAALHVLHRNNVIHRNVSVSIFFLNLKRTTTFFRRQTGVILWSESSGGRRMSGCKAIRRRLSCLLTRYSIITLIFQYLCSIQDNSFYTKNYWILLLSTNFFF